MIQKNLFESAGKKTDLLQAVPIGNIQISPFNPRRTWEEKHVDSIAQLIERNGYDGTQAIKCHEKDGVYFVFAGSNRLKACQKLRLSSIPVFVYSGYTDEELWRMAYEDNEQADAQAQFNMVDIWIDYKAKSEAGWTQQKIADVLGVGRTIVSYRLQMADFGENVIDKIVTSPFLKEGHCREFLELSQSDIFNHETLLCEIIDNVVKRSKEPTSVQFKAEVSKYNDAIKAAETWAKQLKDEFLSQFLDAIKDMRTAANIESQGRIYFKKQTDAEAEKIQAELDKLNEKESAILKAKKEAQKNAKIQEVLERIQLGDASELTADFPDNIKLVFTDPPYGKNFQSNRRIKTEKAAKIQNDSEIGEAIGLFEKVMQNLYPKMANDSAALVWADWKYESAFMQVLEAVGLEVKNSIIWVKSNHGTGDLQGSFAPKHERLIFAVKGKPIFNEQGRLPDVMQGNEFPETYHPTPKPIDMLERIILHLTYPGDIVADPFAGCGTTAISSVRNNRVFHGCEIEEAWHSEAQENINKILKNGI
jgi:site-specific DNA-methyltransferase (adenine-specific)